MPRDPEGSIPSPARDEAVVFCRRESGPIFVSSSEDKRGRRVLGMFRVSGFIPLTLRSNFPSHARNSPFKCFILIECYRDRCNSYKIREKFADSRLINN